MMASQTILSMHIYLARRVEVLVPEVATVASVSFPLRATWCRGAIQQDIRILDRIEYLAVHQICRDQRLLFKGPLVYVVHTSSASSSA